MPLLAHIVDTKFFTLYGTVYAIAQTAVCLAYSLGPLVSGQLIKLGIEFSTLIRAVGFINLIYCPFCLLLRNIDNNGLNEEKVKYNYITIRNNN
jgi:DHA1 family solute carrier family 18 vesicular amine transporter 1/2